MSAPPDVAARRQRLAAGLGPRQRPVVPLGRWRGRVVAVLKLLLPLAAFGLLALVVLWPRLQGTAVPFTVELPDSAPGAVQMLNPRYSGVDPERRPYSIAGLSARQSADEADAVLLEAPKAEITLDDGTWLALRAESGRIDRVRGHAVLSGDVNVYRDDGYAFYTDEVYVDVELRQAWGDRPVAVHGPAGEVTAEGFRIDERTGAVLFTGRSRLVLRPSSAPSS